MYIKFTMLFLGIYRLIYLILLHANTLIAYKRKKQKKRKEEDFVKEKKKKKKKKKKKE